MDPVPPSTMEAASVLWNISRAFLARLLFVLHSVATVWQTATVTETDWLWGFALLILLVVFEGSHTIIMRAGDERKWFCISVLLYVLATAPSIWMLEFHLCEFRQKGDPTAIAADTFLPVQMIEQVMLVVLIVGRWLLPKGAISSEQLTQILLAYLAIASDIVEFFDVFKERVVYSSKTIQQIVLFAWTMSLLQFPFVLTVSRARKMRVAITDADELYPHRKTHNGVWRMSHDVDLWAILLANCLQDIPFLLVRLFLMFFHRLSNYTMIFFTCKNALIIVLQTYRYDHIYRFTHLPISSWAIVLISDRYISKPSTPAVSKAETPRKKRRPGRGDSRGHAEDEELMLVEPVSTSHARHKKTTKGGGHSKRGASHAAERHQRSPPARSGSLDAREIVVSGGSSAGGDHNRNSARPKSKGKRRADRGARRESRERDRV